MLKLNNKDRPAFTAGQVLAYSGTSPICKRDGIIFRYDKLTMEHEEKENIWNLPNFLTFSRIIISVVTVYLIFADFDVNYIVAAFVIGMLTDAADGQVARRFKLTTEFGRKFDVIADRCLMIPVALAAIVKFTLKGTLTGFHTLQIFLLLTREIITFSYIGIAAIFKKKAVIPKVRFNGKATTLIKAISFPIILLSMSYSIFNISLYFVLATGFLGFISSFYYIYDVNKQQ